MATAQWPTQDPRTVCPSDESRTLYSLPRIPGRLTLTMVAGQNVDGTGLRWFDPRGGKTLMMLPGSVESEDPRTDCPSDGPPNGTERTDTKRTVS